jgi:hypothetical protein
MKIVFDSKAAPADADDADQEKERVMDSIMEIFSAIMHKIYKFEPDALAYSLKSGPAGYLISFQHSAAPDIGDPSFAANYDRAFFRDMRAFLQELRDLGANLKIVPNELAIGTPSLLSLVDALDLYFKQDNCPLTHADNAVANVPARDPDDLRQVTAALRTMANDGRALARDNKDAYGYYLTSAPHQLFVSLDHYYATIAARAKADVPVSLDLLRKDALSVEPADDTIGMDEGSMALEDSFRNCARWREDAPSIPPKEGAFLLLKDEAHWQFARVVRQMLIDNYGLAQEMATGVIEVSVDSLPGGYSKMRFSCPVMPEEKTFSRYLSAFHTFGENFLKAGGGREGADLLPVRDNTLMLIHYNPETLFRVTTNMAAYQHPGNLQAQTHLRSLAHIKERIELGVPASALN